MGYLLDTNVVSALRRPEKLEPKVYERIRAVDAQDSFVSVISVMEIELGIRLAARRDTAQHEVLRRWFGGVLESLGKDRIIAFEIDMALICADLHVPDRRSHNDAMIAATAISKNLTLVTRNAKDFEGTGVQILNPWI